MASHPTAAGIKPKPIHFSLAICTRGTEEW